MVKVKPEDKIQYKSSQKFRILKNEEISKAKREEP